MSEEKITLSIIKADVGSMAGHVMPHPDQLAAATKVLAEAKQKGL